MLSTDNDFTQLKKLDYFEVIQRSLGIQAIYQCYQEDPDHINSPHPKMYLRPIDYACVLGNGPVVEILVLLGAHHNTANALDNNKYPIHYAAEHGHIHIIKFLLANGANFEEIDSNNKNVLDYAKCSSSSDCKTACENKRDLLPLIQQINWKNRIFIEAALSDLKNATFRKNCPHNLNQFFYAENDVSLWACLDDNLEVLKQYSGEVDRAKYLPIVLAFRRKELLDYYLNSENEYGAVFDITEWDFQCVIFSGDCSNIEHPRLNGFFPYYANIGDAIASSNIEMLEKCLREKNDIDKHYEYYLNCAIRTCNQLMLSRIIQLTQHKFDNMNIELFDRLLQTAVSTGNMTILEMILKLDQKLILDERHLDNAIIHGHCNMVNKIFSAVPNAKINLKQQHAISLAFQSGNLNMLEMILQIFQMNRQDSLCKITVEQTSLWLKSAIKSCNPTMVIRVLALNRFTRIDREHLVLAILTGCTEMENAIKKLMLCCQKEHHNSNIASFNRIHQTRSVTDHSEQKLFINSKYLVPNIWVKIMQYSGFYAGSLAQTSKFFSKVSRKIKHAKMCEKFSRFSTLANKYSWRNPHFITAVFTRILNNEFYKRLPITLKFLLHDKNNISVWCVLDDNIELFKKHNQLLLNEYKDYLALAIAFGRTEIVYYLLTLINVFTPKELEELLTLAFLSGLPQMVDVVISLRNRAIPDSELIQLLGYRYSYSEYSIKEILEFLPLTRDKIISHVSCSNISEILVTHLSGSPEKFVNNYILKLSSDYISNSIASGSLAMIDNLLIVDPNLTFTKSELLVATSLGNIHIFKKIIQLSGKIAIDQDILVSGIQSGNVTLVDYILSLNNTLEFSKNELHAAIKSGNIKMLEIVLARNKLLVNEICNAVGEDTTCLDAAIQSKNIVMVDKIISMNDRATPDEFTLKWALESGVPEMVDLVFAGNNTLQLNIRSLEDALEGGPQILKKVFELEPSLLNDSMQFFYDDIVYVPTIYKHLLKLIVSIRNRTTSSSVSTSFNPKYN